MKRYILTAMIITGLVLGTVPAYAEQKSVRSPGLNGEIRIGVVLGEEFLRQALPVVDQVARDAIPNVEGSVLVRLNGKLVRVMKSNRTVIEILDDPGTYAGEFEEHGEKYRREGREKAEERERENWKRHQEKQREQAKNDAEREREASKRAAEQDREARKDREELERELGKSREERAEEVKGDWQIRL